MWKSFGTKKKKENMGGCQSLGDPNRIALALIVFLMGHCYSSAFVAKVVADTATGIRV